MKYAAIAILLFASCGAGPLVTEAELQETLVESDARMDQGAQRVLDMIVSILRSLMPEKGADIPDVQYDRPPPTIVVSEDGGVNWENLIALAITALTGSAGAVGLRVMSKKREAKKKQLA